MAKRFTAKTQRSRRDAEKTQDDETEDGGRRRDLNVGRRTSNVERREGKNEEGTECPWTSSGRDVHAPGRGHVVHLVADFFLCENPCNRWFEKAGSYCGGQFRGNAEKKRATLLDVRGGSWGKINRCGGSLDELAPLAIIFAWVVFSGHPDVCLQDLEGDKADGGGETKA